MSNLRIKIIVNVENRVPKNDNNYVSDTKHDAYLYKRKINLRNVGSENFEYLGGSNAAFISLF